MNDDVSYIENIARKRVSVINNNMKKNGDKIYVDVSKYFARGLHIGFHRVIPLFSLIHLVRDPILNMRSFLNMHKNFYLDNNSPDDLNLFQVIKQNQDLQNNVADFLNRFLDDPSLRQSMSMNSIEFSERCLVSWEERIDIEFRLIKNICG